jgi:GWxTD domain-containing protein
MIKIILISVFLFHSAAFSQNIFKVDFDFARFFYDDSTGYVEIYYSFYQPQLKLVSSEGKYSCGGTLQIKFIDKSTGLTAIDKMYNFNNELIDTTIDRLKSLTGNLGFLLPFGNYICYLTGSDLNDSLKVDTVSYPVTISGLPKERFSISDIQLATSIKQVEQSNSMFYKNTYEVVPNPSRIFGESLPIVYFYTELYNVNLNAKSDYYTLRHILVDVNNKSLISKQKKVSTKITSMVEVGALNITKIPTGAYTLVVALIDSVNNQSLVSTKRLFIYNPKVVDTNKTTIATTEQTGTQFLGMSDEELDEMFGYASYVATIDERSQWESIDNNEGKRAFLSKFWKARDDTPGTPENEIMKSYLERVKYSNDKFGTTSKKGWKSDRGRVYITYGEPSEIERYPNQVDTKPYEIWYYNHIEGGVIFIFADVIGFNEYLLVHSTVRGELRDDNWERKIQVLR